MILFGSRGPIPIAISGAFPYYGGIAPHGSFKKLFLHKMSNGLLPSDSKLPLIDVEGRLLIGLRTDRHCE